MLKKIFNTLTKTVKDTQVALYVWIFIFVFGLETIGRLELTEELGITSLPLLIGSLVINTTAYVVSVFLIVFIFNSISKND